MIRLTKTRGHLLKEGNNLLIKGKSDRDSYKSISIKKLIIMPDGDIEVLINKSKNYYFSFKLLTNGMSWAKEVYLLN